MKNLLAYLQRYYRVIYDFKLFKEYLKEPLYKAILFLVPLFLIFTFQTFFGSLAVPNQVVDSMDYYYEEVSTMTYSDLIDFNQGTWDVQPNEMVNVKFVNSKIELDQNKVYDNTFSADGKDYRLILDTKRSYNIDYNIKGSYTEEEKKLMGVDSAYMVVYVADNFFTINLDGVVYSRDLSVFKDNKGNTTDIYQFGKDNYVQGFSFFIFSILVTMFLYLMFYAVIYIISKSTTKKQGYKLTKGRLVRICLYSMQPGMYVYFILTVLMNQFNVGLSFATPLLGMITMAYVASKSLDHVKDYVKRESRKIRKSAQKANLQDV